MKRLPDTELEVMKALWASERAPVPRSSLEEALRDRGWATNTFTSGEGLCLLREAGQDQLLHPPGPSGGLSGL